MAATARRPGGRPLTQLRGKKEKPGRWSGLSWTDCRRRNRRRRRATRPR